MKKILLFVCIAALLSGCNIRDVEKRAFVVAMGVDKAKEKDKLEISLKVSLPTGDPKAGLSKFTIITVQAESIAEAMRIAKSKIDKELDFGHTRVIMLGKNLLSEDIKPIIYWAQRRRDIQMISHIAAAQPDAKTVIAIQPKTETIPGSYLVNLFDREGSESPFVIPEYLFDLQRKISEFGWDPVLPLVEAQKDNLVVERAILLNDEKMKVTLSPDETRLLNILKDDEIKSSFTAIEHGKIKYTINEESSRAKFRISEGNHPTITFNVKMSGVLEEDRVEGYFTKEKAQEAARLIEQELNRKMVKLLMKCQKSKVDPLGFGLRYQATHVKKDEQEVWNELYPRIKFKVNSKVDIQSTGIIK
ncbi:Ger(x)C family spore germination protein [Peribacillus deserti]|uniref:Ger(X)C family spore germination protein n=1 Tax=Peribacillus deserti TaxID=673318 RepID=A0A2N5M457_9BACI|nr:Ger(x)C family spore germination protein [Peribacillus deserti]PLT29122.1 Ger(x)C family spore germination protein [Peribacillus deserti]